MYGGAASDSITTIKEMQRSDPIAKEQWGVYCETHGGGVRDPAKHDDGFIQTFIAQYNEGKRMEGGSTGAGGDSTSLPMLFKEGQRRSQAWKECWWRYCEVYGGGVRDPAKHDQSFLVGFLDFMGQSGSMGASMGMGMGMGMPMMPAFMMGGPSYMEPNPKRARTGPRPSMSWGGKGGGSIGYGGGWQGSDPEKDGLVQRIKAFQRSGDEQKQTWWSFCDSMHGGIRDPMRHDASTLQQFIDMNGVP